MLVFQKQKRTSRRSIDALCTYEKVTVPQEKAIANIVADVALNYGTDIALNYGTAKQVANVARTMELPNKWLMLLQTMGCCSKLWN